MERLGQEALDLARPGDRDPLVFAQLLNAQDGDDVLQVPVLLQHPLHTSRHLVVLVAHDARIEDRRRRGQRVNGRIEALIRQRALQRNRRVKMGEGRHWGRVRIVVRRDVHRLHRGDRALLGRGDALLQSAHLRGQRRLVAHG